MSFSVRRVQDPAIYVRRNKPDILGIGNAWDNIEDFKDALNKLEHNIDAVDKPTHQKLVKKTNSVTGPVLKEISSETQHLGKVTRFQLLGENHSYKGLPKHSVPSVEIKTRCNDLDKAVTISDLSSINRETYSKSSQGVSVRNGYSPSRYSVNERPTNERPSFFTTTTVNPVVLNETSSDSNRNKESSFSNTTVNSYSNHSQQFSLSTAPSFHGKAVLAKNEAGLQKIKEKVQKQKAMLSRQDDEITNATGGRKLHDNREKVVMPSEPPVEKEEVIPLKRKVGAISSAGPSYRGFNPVSSQKSKKSEKRKSKSQQNTNKTSKEANCKGPAARPFTKQEPKLKKAPAKMNRIVSSKCPKEVISTTSWREGRATVKKILSGKKGKSSALPSSAPTYNITSPTQDDELSEGKLSSDENEKREMPKPKATKLEVEKDIAISEEIGRASDSDDDEKLKDGLSNEAQSMLAELAQDNSESEGEMNEEQPRTSDVASKKTSRGQRPKTMLKHEEKYPKEKSRHYDQTEVQKYMAQQIAERKKKMKQEKILKKKQEDEKQKRLKDLYERQKKSFAIAKREKYLGQTSSCDNGALYIPAQDSYATECTTGQSESDKENTVVDDVKGSNSVTSFDDYSEDEIIDSEDDDQEAMELQVRSEINQPIKQVVEASQLDTRAQRLSALNATALALQSRLLSQAIRLGSANEVPQATRAAVGWEEKHTEFQGILPGVTNIRKRADENEKQMARVQAATKIQAAYRGHNVRKRSQWKDDDAKSDVNSVVSSISEHIDDMVIVDNDKHTLDGARDDQMQSPLTTSSHDVDQFDLRYERSRFQRATDVPDLPSTLFSVPSVPFEPKGDRFSVMNVFTRRHPITIEEILDEQPGSETASLLDVEGKTDPKEEYEDDFTDEDISTASVLAEGDAEGDLRKESPVASKEETYSECFESEEERPEKDSTMRDMQEESSATIHSSQSPTTDEAFTFEGDNATAIIPVMTSTIHPEHHLSSSLSLSDESEPVARPVFIKPVQRSNRLSPDSLQRKLTAEINLLENVEDSVRQVNDIEKTRAISIAQQETVSLAQIVKAKQQNHEQEIEKLRLKVKDEAIQADIGLEKARQAAAMAAAAASETLARVNREVLKTNAEHSMKYVEEASKMASCVLTDTTQQLAEFCKNVTITTSAAVQQLHKIDRPTTTLVERATSYSEGHTEHLGNESVSEEYTRTSDVYSNQSKSWETSPSVTSGHQQEGYSSDDFESYKSRIHKKEESESKMEHKHTTSASLSVESIPEDLPNEHATDDDTTINEESLNDSQSLSIETGPAKGRGAVSPASLEYSSQFDDSSHGLTDDDIGLCSLLPSKVHQRKSFKRINHDSFDEEKGKGKTLKSPFESDDSFGKFTVDIIQQYMKEEEVRRKHQTAILRLREKSLEEKTNAELLWLKQLKKQSRNKGSDDVMPSIKKRKRGILLKLEAEKEEIKCLKAANRAASFQRRFMICQQQEIARLHQATLNIRKRIQGDDSKRSLRKSLHELSSTQPKTPSLINGTNSSIQTSPSNSLSDLKKSSKTSFVKSVSPSAKSVSEDISEEQGTFHASPAAASSPFPSYSAPKSQPSPDTAQHTQPPKETETTNTFDMKSFVGPREPETLGERQPKSEENDMLQKVTEIINNQKNVVTRSSHGNDTTSESARTPSTISEVQETEKTHSSLSHSESSIPEDLASTGKTMTSEEIKVISKKSASEYTNCTFESDDTTPSRPSTVPQDSSHNSTSRPSTVPQDSSHNSTSRPSTVPQDSNHNNEAHVEDKHYLFKETSEHSDYEEIIKKLKNEIQNMKADALQKNSAMEIKVLTLELELKSARKDIQQIMDIKTAPVLPPLVATSPGTATKQRPLLSKQKTDPSEADELSVSKQKKLFESFDHEVEESFIEILDEPPTTLKDRTKSGSLSVDRSDGSDTPDEISEHLESDTSSVASIPGEREIIEDQQDSTSKALDFSQNTPQKSYTEPESSPSIPEISANITEDSRSVVQNVRDSPDKTTEIDEDLDDTYTAPQSSTSIPEDLPDSHETTPEVSDEVSEHPCTEQRSITSIAERFPSVTEEVYHGETSSVLDDQLSQNSSRGHEKSNQSESLLVEIQEDLDERSEVSDKFNISEDLPEVEDDISAKSDVMSAEKEQEEFPASKDSENLAEKDVRDADEESFDISEDLPEVEDDISAKSDVISAEKEQEEFPTLKDSELPPRSEDTEGIQNLRVTIPYDVGTAEKATPIIPGTSNTIVEKKDVSEKSSVEQEHDAREDDEKSPSQISSIAEEIASEYEDEDLSDIGSLKEESGKVMFEGMEKVEKPDIGEKDSYEWDSSESSTHTSAGNEDIAATESKTAAASSLLGDYREENNKKESSLLGDYREENDKKESSQKLDVVNNESPISESSKSEKVNDVEKEGEDPTSQEEEQQYSDDFDDDDEETESEIPEMLEEEGEDENNEDFQTFTADNMVTGKGETQDDLDDITDEIYREIMDDSFVSAKTAKNTKSRGKVEQKSPTKAEEIPKKKDKSSITTGGITKDLLADAILQMMDIKRRKNPGCTIPPVISSQGERGGGFDEETAVKNALVIANSSQALNKDALKTMNQDIEGLLGMSLDNEEDEFKVIENNFTDVASDDTEPSVHEYSPMFAVPHNLEEVTSIVNSTVDMLLVRKRRRIPLDNCEPTAQVLGVETENEFENRSTRSYKNLVFDLTKELFIDTVTQNEVARQPPWTKAKWKGGQKLSRNFSRCKSDDEVRALVLERVVDTIGLGAPRTTMKTLQRKTPVRGNKKDNVDAILIEELRQEEPQWTDYDEDEIAVKFQIADSILNMLLDDTVRVFNAIDAKRNIPDNVLVI